MRNLAGKNLRPSTSLMNANHSNPNGPGAAPNRDQIILIMRLHILSDQAIVDNLVQTIQNFFGDRLIQLQLIQIHEMPLSLSIDFRIFAAFVGLRKSSGL